jgi:hypothetical protein
MSLDPDEIHFWKKEEKRMGTVRNMWPWEPTSMGRLIREKDNPYAEEPGEWQWDSTPLDVHVVRPAIDRIVSEASVARWWLKERAETANIKTGVILPVALILFFVAGLALLAWGMK